MQQYYSRERSADLFHPKSTGRQSGAAVGLGAIPGAMATRSAFQKTQKSLHFPLPPTCHGGCCGPGRNQDQPGAWGELGAHPQSLRPVPDGSWPSGPVSSPLALFRGKMQK